MAFCFEHSAAAKQVSSILRGILVDDGASVDVDTLMSDVLFNSQQPGVRNAFYCREAIEGMARDVMSRFSKQGGGRMSMNKLARAVRNVLSVWAEWNVFNNQLVAELRTCFKGDEGAVGDGDAIKSEDVMPVEADGNVDEEVVDKPAVIREAPQGQ
jgi:U2-associated protein SR140